MDLGKGGGKIATGEEPLQIPADLMLEIGTRREIWNAIWWAARRYSRSPNWGGIQEIPSVVTCHADEIRRPALQRMGVYQFPAAAASWLDVGMQILSHERWSPQCAERSCRRA